MFRVELEHLLARCGFAIRDIWGGFDFDFELFGQAASDELVVLAEWAAGALQPVAATTRQAQRRPERTKALTIRRCSTA
jgi:hypothetical protein